MIGWHSLAKIRRSPEFDPPQGHFVLTPFSPCLKALILIMLAISML